MSITWLDLAGFVGVAMIVIAYFLLQLERLPSTSRLYSFLNALGSLLVIISLLFAFNLAAFLVELFWFLISVMGFTRAALSHKTQRA